MGITTALDERSRSFHSPAILSAAPTSASPALYRRFDALRSLALFSDASAAELLRLAEESLLKHFERGCVVVGERPSDDCVVLVSGRAKRSMPRGIASGDFALAIIDAGELLSVGCWARAATPEPGETISLEPSTALYLPRRALEALLERNGKVAVKFLVAVAARLRRVIDLATRNSCLEVADRLYLKLTEMAATRGRAVEGGLRIDHGLFQSELAAGIGASREAVNRQLATWRDSGLVDIERRSLLVRDPLGLSQAVSPSVRTTWPVAAAKAAGQASAV